MGWAANLTEWRCTQPPQTLELRMLSPAARSSSFSTADGSRSACEASMGRRHPVRPRSLARRRAVEPSGTLEGRTLRRGRQR